MILSNFYETGIESLLHNKIAIESFVHDNRGINPIFEETWKQLIKQMDSARKGRSGQLKGAYYKGVLNKKGWIKFETPSQTVPGKRYYQYIKLLDMKDIDALKDLTTREAARLLLSGDIAVYCSCPDFQYYGFSYMAHNLGYGIKKEDRFPVIRNPNLKGTVCKHLGLVLQVYMRNWFKIHRDLIRTAYFRSRWEGD